MTDRPSLPDDDLLLDALEHDGDLSSLAGVSPSLRAEIEGLRAVRSLLNADAAWGESSGTDAPPAHLFDAIMRAEVAARPDAIRQAIVAAPSSTTKPLWARLSSWLAGGGLVVGAAAAVLLTVQRAPELQNAAATADVAAVTTPPVAPPPPAPDSKPAEPVVADASVGGLLDGVAASDTAATADTADTADKVALQEKSRAKADAFAAASATGASAALRSRGNAQGGGMAAGKGRADFDDAIDAPKVAAVADNKAGPAKDSGVALGFAADELKKSEADSAPASPATMAPPPATPAPAPPAEVPVTSANEVRRIFREQLAAKQEARKEAAAPAKSKKSPASRASAAPGYEDMQRDRQAQEANGILVTAENELAKGRFQSAVDLAQRAEAAAGGTLGLAPASTMARGFLGLKRPADAARVGSRLLNGDVADPQLVDGLLAAARAALDIGDQTLARRLLQHALRPANVDVARRAAAQKLMATVSRPSAREAEAAPAAAAKSSTSSSTP